MNSENISALIPRLGEALSEGSFSIKCFVASYLSKIIQKTLLLKIPADYVINVIIPGFLELLDPDDTSSLTKDLCLSLVKIFDEFQLPQEAFSKLYEYSDIINQMSNNQDPLVSIASINLKAALAPCLKTTTVYLKSSTITS